MNSDNITLFCDIVVQRSDEHSQAIQLLMPARLYGQVMSTLRQELDSMVRVMYLLSINDMELREHYINQTLDGERWVNPNTGVPITDNSMVRLANRLYGWANYVYKLGCAFVHLSAMTYYKESNPFLLLSQSEVEDIKRYLNQYHEFPVESELNMETIAPYLNMVFDKVRDNLGYYVGELRQGRSLW